jgi:hypothetical protein
VGLAKGAHAGKMRSSPPGAVVHFRLKETAHMRFTVLPALLAVLATLAAIGADFGPIWP